MSSESLAAFRKSYGDELANLAEQHLQHDLEQSDRDALKSAASKVGTHATVGSIIGLGLGIFLAFRLRQNRTAMFKAFKAIERPTSVVFADGRTEQLPDLAPMLKPTTLGDVFTYLFFSTGGLFIGGESGLLTGSASAQRTISKNPEARARIETAFRKFKADALRKQADELDGGKGNLFGM